MYVFRTQFAIIIISVTQGTATERPEIGRDHTFLPLKSEAINSQIAQPTHAERGQEAIIKLCAAVIMKFCSIGPRQGRRAVQFGSQRRPESESVVSYQFRLN
jgi:hypothetical protein